MCHAFMYVCMYVVCVYELSMHVYLCVCMSYVCILYACMYVSVFMCMYRSLSLRIAKNNGKTMVDSA